MNFDPWTREAEVAMAAARDGMRVARAIRQRTARALLKSDRSPVTVADFAVQALVAHRLRSAFPDDSLVAEEDAGMLRDHNGRGILTSVQQAIESAVANEAWRADAPAVLDAIDLGRGQPDDRFWTLDPIDGTQGFLRGDHYVIALALIIGGQVDVGVLGCPEMELPSGQSGGDGTIALAVRGRGAFRVSDSKPFSPLHVSDCRDARRARVLRSFEEAHIDLARCSTILSRLGVGAPARLMDSQAKHAVIAAGGAELLIRTPATAIFRDKIWDQAAGTLLIEEAGGRVTDLRGGPLDFAAGVRLARNEGVLASNGHLHAAALAAVGDGRSAKS
jgi:3'(2'), 5'-bisphosphate nucleotidase